MSAKFDEFPSLPFQDIKEKPKRHGRTDGKMDNVKTVCPPTNIVCGWYKYFYGIKLLCANVQCIYIVYAKYQMASVKTLVQVDFPVHALSEH